MKGDENPVQIDLSHSPFQVHIHGLPIRMMTIEVVEAIGARSCIVMDYATTQSQVGWESKTRVKVSLDVRKPLKRGLLLRSPGGDEIMVSFTYEKLPTFCYSCGVLGHIMRDCATWLEKLDRDQQRHSTYSDMINSSKSGPKMAVETSKNQEFFEDNLFKLTMEKTWQEVAEIYQKHPIAHLGLWDVM
ncbi:UNVERIFIED_CONTAM: hypothetical protein Slati_4250800 [Sesamum latifolium]|uniref:CCHC-type domain-containing protein n=1 Tax=Sesamum latifolium TaxID=2727402 RepID=A0AAW2TBP5_9LAMI